MSEYSEIDIAETLRMVEDLRNGWTVFICFISLLTGIFIISYELYIPFSTIPEDKSIREVLAGEELNSLTEIYEKRRYFVIDDVLKSKRRQDRTDEERVRLFQRKLYRKAKQEEEFCFYLLYSLKRKPGFSLKGLPVKYRGMLTILFDTLIVYLA